MQRKLRLGVLFMLASTLSYSLLATIVKYLDNSIEIPTIVFIQSLVCLGLLLPVMLRGEVQDMKRRVQSNYKGLHLLRAVCSLGISYFLFLAVSHMPLVNAMLLANTAPFMVPLLGALLMGHTLNHRIWLPLMLGFIGVVFVLQPDKGAFQPAAIYALAAAFCMAMSTLLVRRASKHDSALTITFYYFVYAAVLSSLVAVFFWEPITLQQLFILIVIGILFFICQYSLTLALWHVSAQLVSSLFYTNILFATVFSWVLWSSRFSTYVWLGIIFIIFGGILCVNTQHSHEKRLRHASGGEPHL
jgi:drug/metabolite transporter (DMT)-like permease